MAIIHRGPRFARIVALALSLQLASARAGRAEEAPPIPLRQLVAASDLIVVAEVRAVERLKSDEPSADWFSHAALLVVRGCLKGSAAEGSELRIPFERTSVCPPPPDFNKGTRGIAFLFREPGGAWYWAGGRFAWKTMDNERRLQVYSKRIREACDIAGISDPVERRKKTVDWLIDCAEEPATRWEGAYELARGEDLNPRYEGGSAERFGEALQTSHLRRLAEVVLGSPKILGDPWMRCLAALALGSNDRRVLERLRRELDGVASDPPWDAGKLMRILASGTSWTEGEGLARAYAKVWRGSRVSSDGRDSRTGQKPREGLSEYLRLLAERETRRPPESTTGAGAAK
ncbi:MAG: hypothetical protein HYZ53_21130 [Planctomycetes bacterium]|nr:hypothetical protein [Planctomycetota bacterium]